MIKIFSKYLLFNFFSSFLLSFKNSLRNFNQDILRLVFAFVAFVGSVATSGFVAGSRVRILPNFLLQIISS